MAVELIYWASRNIYQVKVRVVSTLGWNDICVELGNILTLCMNLVHKHDCLELVRQFLYTLERLDFMEVILVVTLSWHRFN